MLCYLKKNIFPVYQVVNFPCCDHLERIINTLTHKRILLSQPYSVSKNNIFNLSNWCDKYNLNFMIDSWSIYRPGSTVAIRIWKND